MRALHVFRTSKRYGELVALDDVSFEVELGETVGLLGPNGAGKTTLLEIICGMRQASSGTVEVLGTEVNEGNTEIWKRAAIALPPASFPPRAKVKELVDFYIEIYKSPDDALELLRAVGLAEYANEYPRKLSNGQKQRLALILTLLGRPDVMILDEPTSELDPHGRRIIWSQIERFKAGSDRSILLATHHMDEAATLCNKVGILVRGRLAAFGTPEALIAKYCPHNILIVRANTAQVPELAGAVLQKEADGEFVYQTDRLGRTLADLASKLSDAEIDSMRVVRPTLEDVFFAVAGESLDG